MGALGVLQPVVEAIVRRLIPGADEEWTAVGIDEFLRSNASSSAMTTRAKYAGS